MLLAVGDLTTGESRKSIRGGNIEVTIVRRWWSRPWKRDRPQFIPREFRGSGATGLGVCLWNSYCIRHLDRLELNVLLTTQPFPVTTRISKQNYSLGPECGQLGKIQTLKSRGGSPEPLENWRAYLSDNHLRCGLDRRRHNREERSNKERGLRKEARRVENLDCLVGEERTLVESSGLWRLDPGRGG
jgi:hypothetical protein